MIYEPIYMVDVFSNGYTQTFKLTKIFFTQIFMPSIRDMMKSAQTELKKWGRSIGDDRYLVCFSVGNENKQRQSQIYNL